MTKKQNLNLAFKFIPQRLMAVIDEYIEDLKQTNDSITEEELYQIEGERWFYKYANENLDVPEANIVAQSNMYIGISKGIQKFNKYVNEGLQNIVSGGAEESTRVKFEDKDKKPELKFEVKVEKPNNEQ